jgi:hypothetical protein
VKSTENAARPRQWPQLPANAAALAWPCLRCHVIVISRADHWQLSVSELSSACRTQWVDARLSLGRIDTLSGCCVQAPSQCSVRTATVHIRSFDYLVKSI